MAGSADFGEQQVPLVAIVLLRRERHGRLPLAALVFPAAVATLHREHVRVAEFGERLGGKCRPNTSGAVRHDWRLLVDDATLDLGFEVTARDVNGTEQGTFVVFVGLADVENNCAVGNRCRRAVCVYFGDRGLCSGEKVAERCHGEKPTNQVGYRVGSHVTHSPTEQFPPLSARRMF